MVQKEKIKKCLPFYFAEQHALPARQAFVLGFVGIIKKRRLYEAKYVNN